MRISWRMVLLAAVAASVTGCGSEEPTRRSSSRDKSEKKVGKDVGDSTAKKEESAAKVSKTVEPETWGNLKGRFVFDGTPPEPKKLTIDKDVDMCAEHNLVDESIVVGQDQGLANVVVFLRSKDVPVHPDYAATAAAEVKLDNNHCRFEPHVLAMRTSQKLLITNSDGIGHNTKGSPLANEEFNSLIQPNTFSSPVIKQAESLPFQVGCNIHPWMGGWVLVRPDPYFAVSALDGRFEIKNLPAGDWEFQVWQEKAGHVADVEIGGKSIEWPKGRLSQTVKAGDNDLGEIKIKAAAFQK